MAFRKNPVVHLELHTGDRPGARAFYTALCGWKGEWVGGTGADEYLALSLARGLGGGIVECGTGRPLWLPYVEVPDVGAATERARALGAELLLEPREGPAGIRAVVASPAGGELALWQHTRRGGR
jgi:predicted enzyme related to lactoylglutathione lyase